MEHSSNFYIRRATMIDLPLILSIINQAIDYLHTQGSPQWQNGFGPTQSEIEMDIRRCEGYVLINKEIIHGYAALIAGPDDAYTNLHDGIWDESEDAYYVIVHRVVIEASVRGKGFAKILIDKLIKQAQDLNYHDIRIDTHAMNISMQKVIRSAGFIFRGFIQLPIPDGERMAFQKAMCKTH